MFAWRATMPTFTDASLIATGTGGLLWTMLATDAAARRRTPVGLLSFLALEGAVAIRYTNLVVLVVALAAVALGRRAARLPWRSVAWWLGSVGLLVAVLGAFDRHYYGAVLKTGYAAGEITFSLSALRPNVEQMPYHLVRTMPSCCSASPRSPGSPSARREASGPSSTPPCASRTGATGRSQPPWPAAGSGSTASTRRLRGRSPSADHGLSVHVIRFYLPALAAIALLAAWLLLRLPRVLGLALLVTLAGLALWSFPGLASGGPGGAGRPLGTPPSGGVPSGPTPSGTEPRSGQAPTGPPPSSSRPASGSSS